MSGFALGRNAVRQPLLDSPLRRREARPLTRPCPSTPALSANQIAAIRRHYDAGLRPEQIAAAGNLTVETVKAALRGEAK